MYAKQEAGGFLKACRHPLPNDGDANAELVTGERGSFVLAHEPVFVACSICNTAERTLQYLAFLADAGWISLRCNASLFASDRERHSLPAFERGLYASLCEH